jgi:hypothetical protein
VSGAGAHALIEGVMMRRTGGPVRYGLREKSRRPTVSSPHKWVKAYQASAKLGATSASYPSGPTSQEPDDDGGGAEVGCRQHDPALLSMAQRLL